MEFVLYKPDRFLVDINPDTFRCHIHDAFMKPFIFRNLVLNQVNMIGKSNVDDFFVRT
jgi:hypothetical protein